MILFFGTTEQIAYACSRYQASNNINILTDFPVSLLEYLMTTFKGYDTFTLFDRFYNNILNELKSTYDSLNGTIRICDIGADTDGYIEFVVKNGVAFVKGQLGASFSSYSLKFEFQADQTLIGRLMQAIELR